jgi:hypothetical protein
MMDAILTAGEVSALVRTIEEDNLDLLESLLNLASGKNVSDHLVTTTLPKQWHHVAKTVKSTPLRTAISWRNIKALDTILKSKCIVTRYDISLGLQKILRHVESSTEVQIIRKLVESGAEAENPSCFTLSFEKLIKDGDADRCQDVMQVICESRATNSLKGLLLLSVAKHSAKNQHECQSQGNVNNWENQWTHFTLNSMRMIMETSFNPCEFVADTKVWLSLGNISFQYLVHALPILIQTSTSCHEEALGWLLRHVGRYYGHTSSAGKEKIRLLPRLMWSAGFNLSRIMAAACLSPRFMHDTGFSRLTQHHKTTMKSLQQSCRSTIRRNITTGNVYCAMERMDCLPTPMKDFILLKEIQSLPWEK